MEVDEDRVGQTFVIVFILSEEPGCGGGVSEKAVLHYKVYNSRDGMGFCTLCGSFISLGN